MNAAFELDHLPLNVDHVMTLAAELKANPLATLVLQDLVLEYMHSHKISNYAIRQRICAGLEIKLLSPEAGKDR
jgi:hypothetical protein